MVEQWTKHVNAGNMIVQLVDNPSTNGYTLSFFMDSVELTGKNIDIIEALTIRVELAKAGYAPLNGEEL